MSVSNGEFANQNTFNNSFMSREVDSDTVGKVDLKNVDAISGAHIINIQRNINALASALGIPINQVHNYLISWASSVVGASSSDVVDKIEALVLKFRDTVANGGHAHTGADGDGAKVSAGDLADYNDYWVVPLKQALTNVSGTSFNVTTEFTGKTPGGGSSTEGVLTDPSNNIVQIIETDTQTFIEDAGGQRVYGRLTEAAGVWTLSFFTNEAGVETAHNLALNDISILYREVFTSANRPTLGANPFDFASVDLTADIADATTSNRGLVSTGAQTFGGNKTFNGFLELLAQFHLSVETDNSSTGADQILATPLKTILEVTDPGLTSIAGLTAPTKNQLFILINKTGGTLELKNNNTLATHILTGENGTVKIPNNGRAVLIYDLSLARWLIVARSVALIGANVGSSPNAMGFTLTGNTLNLEPANAANPGVITALAQILGGLKTFVDGIVVQTSLRSEGFAVIGGNLRMEETNDTTSTGANITLTHPGTAVVRLSNNALTSIDMINNPERGKLLVIINDTGNTLNLNHLTGATAAQQINTGTGSLFAIPNGSAVVLYYENNSLKWRILQVLGSGGGGGSATNAITFRLNGFYGNGVVPQNAVEGFSIIPVNANITNVFMFNVVAGSGGTTELDVKVKPFGSGAFTSIFSTTPKITAGAGNDIWVGVGDVVAGTTAPVLGAGASGIGAKSAVRCDILQKQSGSPQNTGVIIIWESI